MLLDSPVDPSALAALLVFGTPEADGASVVLSCSLSNWPFESKEIKYVRRLLRIRSRSDCSIVCRFLLPAMHQFSGLANVCTTYLASESVSV